MIKCLLNRSTDQRKQNLPNTHHHPDKILKNKLKNCLKYQKENMMYLKECNT